ncbi:MAG: hypothetical protein LAT76_07310, partial [Schleiferiaceae bacterium]|nr:hypothetical protein [Schleiferiaceae bacterium]
MIASKKTYHFHGFYRLLKVTSRNIQTQHPDGSFEKVEFDCWEQKNYDRNDTVVDSDWYTERNSPSPSGSEPTDPDERAAWLAAHHYNTPQILKLDVFGRSYLMQDDNGSYNGSQITHDRYDTTFFLDIEGKQRSYTNALVQETT